MLELIAYPYPQVRYPTPLGMLTKQQLNHYLPLNKGSSALSNTADWALSVFKDCAVDVVSTVIKELIKG